MGTMIRLAIDLDGVVFDCFSEWQVIADREGVQEPFHKEYNGIFKVFCSDGENLGKKLFTEHRDEWLSKSKLFPGVKYALDEIGCTDIKYWFVTSRGEDIKYQTVEAIERAGLTGHEDVLFLKDKTKAPTNTLVDDKPSHIKDYTEKGRMAILMRRPYNEYFNTKHVVTNLYEVYEKLVKL